MKSLLLVAVTLALAFAINIDENAREHAMFEQWMRDNNKVYLVAGEKEMRFHNFQLTLKRIQEESIIMPSATFGLNKFSDMSVEEFQKTHKSAQKYPGQQLARSCLSNGVTLYESDVKIPDALPTSFDWRAKGMVTPVKDQGGCGSCWAFSTIGNIESQNAIKGNKLTQFSEQLIVDCSHSCINEPPYGTVCNQGCDGGWMWSAMYDVLSWGGVETEVQYPYTGQDGTCNLNTKIVTAKISNYTCLTNPNTNGVSETVMAAYLVNHGPISIAMDATPLMDYSSGILNPGTSGCSQNQLDHAILIVGYGVDTTQNPSVPFWIIKNSWASSWGENGYFRIIRGQGACGLNEAVVSVDM
jgi:C1A family cysteine protease